MSNVLEFVQKIEVTSVECCKCGHLIFMSTDFQRRRQRDKAFWHCTSCGQSQHWGGKSDLEKARDNALAELENERRRKLSALADANEQRERAAKAERQRDRLKKRAANGVCPCCTRSFTNLKRHMAAKHADFVEPKCS